MTSYTSRTLDLRPHNFNVADNLMLSDNHQPYQFRPIEDRDRVEVQETTKRPVNNDAQDELTKMKFKDYSHRSPNSNDYGVGGRLIGDRTTAVNFFNKYHKTA